MASEACNLLIFRQRIGYNCHGFSTNDGRLMSVCKPHPLILIVLKIPSLKTTTSASPSFSPPVGEGAVLHYKSKQHNYHIICISLFNIFEEFCFISLFEKRGLGSGGLP